MEISFQLKHGNNKHEVSTYTDARLDELMSRVEEMTGVPVSGQKLIINGRALTSLDRDKKLSDCRIAPGCKVMLLGKKQDPAQDALYQQVVEIQKKTVADYTKLLQVTEEVKEFDKGYLPSEHHEEKLKALLKSCKSCSEGFMRSLEALDDLRFDESQTLAKTKRKTVATDTNKHLDQADEVQKTIEEKLQRSKQK